MDNKKILFTLAAVLLLSASLLHAGDTASFVDLGFSPDGKTYMFAQYGVLSNSLRPWADLFVVDVSVNNFVSGGKLSLVHDKAVVAGQDGSGALYRIIAQNYSLADKYRINYCFQGQPLYIAMDNASPAAPLAEAAIEFRDFQDGTAYRASLVSSVEGFGADLKSSFFISLERTARDGSKKTYTVGTPQLKRPLVSSYRIRKVMKAPGDGSMILVIEMRRQEGADVSIRYMVEALRL